MERNVFDPTPLEEAVYLNVGYLVPSQFDCEVLSFCPEPDVRWSLLQL